MHYICRALHVSVPYVNASQVKYFNSALAILCWKTSVCSTLRLFPQWRTMTVALVYMDSTGYANCCMISYCSKSLTFGSFIFQGDCALFDDHSGMNLQTT